MTTMNSRPAGGRRRGRTVALAAICLAACYTEVDPSTSLESTDAPEVAELQGNGIIRGTDFNRHRLTGGRVELRAVDLRSTPIEAQVERDGTFDVHLGAGEADGTFQIEGVPRGRRYWLRVGSNWYLTRERVVDVGVDALGRPDAIGAAAGTSLVFDVDGLTPVTSGDDFQIAAPDAQIGFYSTASRTNAIAASAPEPGATALTGAVFPFDADAAAGTTQFPLIQASQGDTLTLAQLTTLRAGSVTYQSLSRALTTSVEMTQGVATRVTGAMTAPPPSVTYLDFRQDAFEALADGIHPGAVPTGATVFVDASPGGRRVNLGTPDLAVVTLPAGSGDQRLPLEHRNPYPASWPLFAVTGATFQVPFVGVAEDGSPTVRNTSSNALAWEFVERGHVTLAPLLTSVRDLFIDGEPARDQVQPTTATPVLTWERPRHGWPAAYVIRIVRVIPQAPFAQPGVGRLVVAPDVHRVRIPSGVLQPGEHYYFQVVAVASSQPRRKDQLEILFVPPRARTADAFSSTIRVQ
jgi:hypothetical protein